MMVTGIVSAIVLAFKYVSIPGEQGSVNPVLRDLLYNECSRPTCRRAGSDFQNLSTGQQRHQCRGPTFGLANSTLFSDRRPWEP